MDRFFRGFFAGLIAGIPMNIWSLLSYHFLKFGQLRFLDWMSIMLFSHPPQTVAETVYAQIAHVIWVGYLGIVFAYFLAAVGPTWPVGKALVFSLTIAFFTYVLPFLFKIPDLMGLSFKTVISNRIGAVIWALFLPPALQYLKRWQ